GEQHVSSPLLLNPAWPKTGGAFLFTPSPSSSQTLPLRPRVSRHIPGVACGQAETERILREAVAPQGVTPQGNPELAGIGQDALSHDASPAQGILKLADGSLKAESLGGLHVDHELEFGRLLHRQISRLLAENAAAIVASVRYAFGSL